MWLSESTLRSSPRRAVWLRSPCRRRRQPHRPPSRLAGMSRAASVGDDPFVVHRSLLFTVAYELLGSAADAEDVLQESWLRWATVDQAEIREPRAYLVRIVTRQALNQLRAVS